MGVLSGTPIGCWHVDGAEAVDGAGVCLRAAHAQVVAAHLRELPADPSRGVEGGAGILEHHGQGGAQEVAVQALPAAAQVGAQQAQARGVHDARLLDELRHRQRRERLARAGLPDDAHRLARLDPEGQAPHRPHRALGRREGDAQVTHVEECLAAILARPDRAAQGSRLVRRDGHRDGGAHARSPRRVCFQGREAEALGDGLAEEVEGETGHDDGHTRSQRPDRLDVDARQAVHEQPAPVVGRGLHAEAEERQPGEGQQGRAGADGGVDDEGLTDVGQHVPHQEPPAVDARDPRGGHEVALGDAGDERLAQARERRRAGQPDGQHRAHRADPEDDREEERQQQPREGHRDVDGLRQQPAEASAHQHRPGAQQEPHADRDQRSPRGPARPRAGWPPARGRGCRGPGCPSRPSAPATGRPASGSCRPPRPARPRPAARSRPGSAPRP